MTAGLATLCAAYILFYTLLFTLFRLTFSKTLPTGQTTRDAFKRFRYRACQALVLVDWLVVFGVSVRCTGLAWSVRSGLALKGTDGVGVGVGRESTRTAQQTI